MQLILYDHDSSFVLLQQLTQCLTPIINIVTYWHRLIQVPHYKQQTQALADISKKKKYLLDFKQFTGFLGELGIQGPKKGKLCSQNQSKSLVGTTTCCHHCTRTPVTGTVGTGPRMLPLSLLTPPRMETDIALSPVISRSDSSLYTFKSISSDSKIQKTLPVT